VQLDGCWRDMIAGRGYAPATRRLLGELAAVTVLITASLKQRGRLTFQVKGSRAIGRLVMDCDQELRLRGMAQEVDTPASARVGDLLGEGFLTMTLDAPDMRVPYQSQVPLVGETIAEVFEHYLAQSEQAPARLWLAADDTRAAGLFLQPLPGAERRDPDGWNRVQMLAGTVSRDELLTLGAIALLGRLFAEEDVRVYDPRPVSWHCPEDWAKIHAMLRALGREECESIVRDVGEIHVHDDICNRDYHLTAADVAKLFAA
jgi:molecular chaperone Hsp33